MRNRASLQLMEQLIMILVFGVAAALCLQVFAKSAEISRKTACQDEAVLTAWNGAELYKNGQDACAALQNEHFSLEITENRENIPGFESIDITVSCECGVQFSLCAGRQGVSP